MATCTDEKNTTISEKLLNCQSLGREKEEDQQKDGMTGNLATEEGCLHFLPVSPDQVTKVHLLLSAGPAVL